MKVTWFIILYLVGWLTFTTFSNFDNEIWCDVYYIWQSVAHGGVLAWATIYYIGDLRVRKTVKWVLVFSIIMSVWDIVRVAKGIDVNSHWAVMVAFLLVISVTTILTLHNSKHPSKIIR